jgi:enoyl-CoA hydratase/carnithine racemase
VVHPEAFETIRYQRDGDVGTLTLARPAKRNAQNPLMWQELSRLGAELLPDQTLRCLVVAGEGPAFSAGIDLAEGIGGLLADLAARPAAEDSIATAMALAGTFGWIPALGCPSVAAVRGHAYGAGLQLALACDFRVFAEGVKVGLLETRYGLMPDMGATFRLPRIVGESRARELILLGDIIDADEALRIGLANKVVADASLDAAAAELAGRLAAQPPLAIRGARRAIEAAWHSDAAQSLRVAVTEQITCVTSADFAEAGQAMREGRAPRWQGR